MFITILGTFCRTSATAYDKSLTRLRESIKQRQWPRSHDDTEHRQNPTSSSKTDTPSVMIGTQCAASNVAEQFVR